jgi:very-short-patch-repair endonuclease
VPISGTRDQKAAAIAGLQRGRAAREQLRQGAITKSQIQTMVRNGALHLRLPGVYAVGHVVEAELTRETEALLACPWGTILSDLSSGALWNLIPPRRPSDLVHVTVPTPITLHIPTVRSHRTSTLEAQKDVRIHRGLPTVSPARAIVEMAATLNSRGVERALDDGLHRHIVRLTQVRDTLTRAGKHRKGAAVLDGLLRERESGSGITRSGGEQHLWKLLLEARLPKPERNQQLGEYNVDMLWRTERVIVEVDSYDWHLRKANFVNDRVRDADLEAQGFTVLRFTADQIGKEPFYVVARIAAALALAAARAA